MCDSTIAGGGRLARILSARRWVTFVRLLCIDCETSRDISRVSLTVSVSGCATIEPIQVTCRSVAYHCIVGNDEVSRTGYTTLEGYIAIGEVPALGPLVLAMAHP